MRSDDLVFDLGFHNGDDTAFYLSKGLRVVALEANPGLVEAGERRFAGDVEAGRLTLLHKAVCEASGYVDFYVHPNKTDWSSVLQTMAESDGSRAQLVSVQTTDFVELCAEYGTPLYMKVDIEGCDTFVAQQLLGSGTPPQFVSFETSRRDYGALFSYLYVAGYRQFQLVNQQNNPTRQHSQRNGEFRFTSYSSGYFGNDLDPTKWVDFDQLITRYVFYKELKKVDNQELGVGWLDVHARLF